MIGLETESPFEPTIRVPMLSSATLPATAHIISRLASNPIEPYSRPAADWRLTCTAVASSERASS